MSTKIWTTTTVGLLRGVFYATTITMGILLVLQQLDSGNIVSFRWFTLLLSAVFAVEIFSGWSLHYKLSKQMLLEMKSRPLLRAQEIFNHLILPANLFVWTLAFCYFNQQAHVRTAVLIVSFTIFTILFMYIRAFYLQQKHLLGSLHAIFDLCKIYAFFLAVDSILHYANGNLTWTPLLIAALAFGMNCLIIWREDKLQLNVVYLNLFVSLLLLAAIYILLLLGATTVLQVSLLSLIGYYLAAAVVHHYLDGDLHRQLLVEYTLIIVLAVVFLQGLS
jgi:hypothetical protein